MSDFQKWSVLAFRAMDDAGRVLMTIEPESTSEGEMLDRLKETIRDLLTQALVLNGVVTRRQLDERFHFGKLDTDALNAQLAQPAHGDIRALKHRIHELEGEVIGYKRMLEGAGTAAQPEQRKPLTDERILHFVNTHVGGSSPSHPLDNSDWINFARAIEAAHDIKEGK